MAEDNKEQLGDNYKNITWGKEILNWIKKLEYKNTEPILGSAITQYKNSLEILTNEEYKYMMIEFFNELIKNKLNIDELEALSTAIYYSRKLTPILKIYNKMKENSTVNTKLIYIRGEVNKLSESNTDISECPDQESFLDEYMQDNTIDHFGLKISFSKIAIILYPHYDEQYYICIVGLSDEQKNEFIKDDKWEEEVDYICKELSVSNAKLIKKNKDEIENFVTEQINKLNELIKKLS